MKNILVKKSMISLLVSLFLLISVFNFNNSGNANAASEPNYNSLIDFQCNARGRGVNSTLTSLPGSSKVQQVAAKSYLIGGDGSANVYSLIFGDKLGRDGKTAGAVVRSEGNGTDGSTGIIMVAMGKPEENGSAYSSATYKEMKDIKSFSLTLKIENPQGIEKIGVRFFDSDFQHSINKPENADSLFVPESHDLGFEKVFTSNDLTSKGTDWTYIESDLNNMGLVDSFYKNKKDENGQKIPYLGSIENGIYGNRPDNGKPFKLSYVQVYVLFNQMATPSEILFDDLIISDKSVSPTMTLKNDNLTGVTGEKVSLTGKFDVTDNHTLNKNIRYSLSVSKDGKALPGSQVESNLLNFTPYTKGKYIALITAFDEDGNEGYLEAEVNVTGEDIDKVAPVIDSNTLKILTDKSPYKTFDEIDLSIIKATDDVDKNPKIEFTVTHEDGSAFVVNNSKFKPTKNGAYTIRIVATDNSGNSVPKSIRIMIDNPNSDTEGENEKKKCGSMVLGTYSFVGLALISLFAVALIAKRKTNELK